MGWQSSISSNAAIKIILYYKYYAEQEIRPDIEEIWGNSVQFQISIENNGFYSHSCYPGIQENMTILEMEPFLSYEYIIMPGQMLDQASTPPASRQGLSLD